MKPTKRSSFLLFVWLLIICLIVPVFASDVTATSDTSVDESTLYFSINFDDMEEGKISTNSLYNGVLRSATVSEEIVTRYGTNKCFYAAKASGSTTNPGYYLTPFVKGSTNGNLSGVDGSVVLSWQLFISGYDTKSFNLIGIRQTDKSWVNVMLTTNGLISCTDAAGKEWILSENGISYDKWNDIAIILHPAIADDEYGSFDIYVNNRAVLTDLKCGKTADRFTIGKFVGKEADVDSYQMIDHIKFYSGNRICTDEELGIKKTASATTFCGVQRSAQITNEKYNIRLIATVNALSYDAVGFTVNARYAGGGKTITHNSTCVYTSIIQHTDAGIESFEKSGSWFYALTINNIPTSIGKVELEVFTYSVKNGTVTVESKTIITYDNGTVVSVVSM